MKNEFTGSTKTTLCLFLFFLIFFIPEKNKATTTIRKTLCDPFASWSLYASKKD